MLLRFMLLRCVWVDAAEMVMLRDDATTETPAETTTTEAPVETTTTQAADRRSRPIGLPTVQ
ncbi:MAG: hypothetical protein CM1200mP26_24100 [Acidimicrobiales bacterium]|nr:MAG: hypothetical protein CM1200mP26_24100 [Acidimicrobiales bacterium]